MKRIVVLVFSLLAIASLQDVEGSLDNCQSDCKDKYHALKKKSKEITYACSIGCRLAHLDLLTSPLTANISDCKKSCQEAFTTSLQQLACSVGCNLTYYKDTSTTRDENDILTSLLLILNEAFFSSFFTSNVNGGNTMEITVVTAEDNNAEDTIIFITGAASPKSSTRIKNHITAVQDGDNDNEDSTNFDVWFIFQIIAILLLLVLLSLCCCTCSGEARHSLNKRSRDIRNCDEESDSNAFKSHTHKLKEPLGRPCINPISPHIVPVKGSMATTGRQIKTIDGRVLMVA